MYVKIVIIFLLVYFTVTYYSDNANVLQHQVNEFVAYKYLKIRLPGEKEAIIISHFQKYEQF